MLMMPLIFAIVFVTLSKALVQSQLLFLEEDMNKLKVLLRRLSFVG